MKTKNAKKENTLLYQSSNTILHSARKHSKSHQSPI